MKKADVKTKGRADYEADGAARIVLVSAKDWTEEEALDLLRMALKTVRLREPAESNVEMLLEAGEMICKQADTISKLQLAHTNIRMDVSSAMNTLRRSLV